MSNLFAYGTLMCNDIIQNVSGCLLGGMPGALRGFDRRSVRGEHYPALVQQGDGRVDGVLYCNLPESAWKRLDRFEGTLYTRQRVEVELADGSSLPATAYVWRPEFLDLVDSSGWDFTNFLRCGKSDFEESYQGYRSL